MFSECWIYSYQRDTSLRHVHMWYWYWGLSTLIFPALNSRFSAMLFAFWFCSSCCGSGRLRGSIVGGHSSSRVPFFNIHPQTAVVLGCYLCVFRNGCQPTLQHSARHNTGYKRLAFCPARGLDSCCGAVRSVGRLLSLPERLSGAAAPLSFAWGISQL